MAVTYYFIFTMEVRHILRFTLDSPFDFNPCTNCGACCTDTQISLSPDDRALLENAGATMTIKEMNNPKLNNYVWGIVYGDCPFLVRNENGGTECKIYYSDEKRRPLGCVALSPRSDMCNQFRLRAGLPYLSNEMKSQITSHTVENIVD